MPNPRGANVPYRIVGGAAGSRHLTLLTEEGHLIMTGSNRHGQVGQPAAAEKHDEFNPCFYDLGFGPNEAPTDVACGTNYNIIYRRGTLRAVVIGNNTYGQLGAGHKDIMNNLEGFGEWNENAPWWRGVSSGLRTVVCGHNHTLMQLEDGRIFACGCNLRGELGIGSLVSPMQPQEIKFFSEQGIRISRMAAGCSFSLFLAEDGRVFGCGNGSNGQVERDDKYVPKMLRVTRQAPLPGQKANLMRIRDIACTSDMTVVVNTCNEVFIRGSAPDYGFERGLLFYQVKLPQQLKHIAKIVTSTNTVYLVGDDGAVFGFGGNAEGQLVISPGRVNLSPTYVIDEAVEVLPAPSQDAVAASSNGGRPLNDPLLIASNGFAVVVDELGRYPVAAKVNPIQFPEPLPIGGPKKRSRMKF